MKLSVIIVSYNVCDYLRQCLASIYKSDIIQNIEIIVIDNHSHDQTHTMISNNYCSLLLMIVKMHETMSFI